MTFLTTHGRSVRKACKLAGVPRSTHYYEPTPRISQPPDRIVREAVVEIATERPSFGYRRTTAMVRRRLRRAVNTKVVRRIMKDENLTLEPCVQPRARVRKHAGKLLTPAPDLACQVDMKYVWCGRDGWGYLQNAIEGCTSEWLGYVFSKRCGAKEAVELLERVVTTRFPSTCRAPGTRLRVDNGPCYRADAFRDQAERLGFEVEHIQVRTPEDNGIVESFHAGLDRDYLGGLVFDSFDEAKRFLEVAFVDYNEVKPKERLGWRTPKEFNDEVRANAT